MFLSGGVDSSVAFALLNEALSKERVLGLFIDNGFLRLNEAEQILQSYEQLGYDNVVGRDYSEAFLEAIAGEVDPQRKRHQVGNTFLAVREKLLEESRRMAARTGHTLSGHHRIWRHRTRQGDQVSS